MSKAETCVCCGAIIPEGLQVYHACQDNPPKQKKEDKKLLIYIFPIALILLDVGAAVMCVISKDYKRAVYWLAAAVLNVCVTF